MRLRGVPILFVILLGALGIALAACGSDSDDGDSPTPTSASTTPGAEGTPNGEGGAGGSNVTLSVADGTGTIGQQVNVQLDALGIGTPGLGAYTVDVAFDTNIVTAVSCNGNSGPGVTPVAPVNTPAFEAPGLSFCNPKYAENTVRSVGAVAEGASGDVPLAVITFTCDAAGTTGLTISVSTFADATVGSPTDINHTEDNGTITCS